MELLHHKTSSNSKLIVLVFSFFLLINLASAGGHFDPVDGVQEFLLVESMALKHSAKLQSSLNPDLPSLGKLFYKNTLPYNLVDPLVPTDKPSYSLRSLLLAAIAVPFYYAALIFSVSPITVVALFVESTIISLTSVVIFCFSLELYRSKKISFVLSLIFVACSYILSYNNFFEQQPLQGLCIITAAFFIFISTKRSDNNKRIYFAGLSGLFLGFSVFAHPTSIIVIPGFIVYSLFSMRNTRKSLFSFLLLLAIILLLMGLVNYVRFGSFTEFGYGTEGLLSAHQGMSGLLGLLISPGVGLIFYFPIVILAPLAFKNMYRDYKGLTLLFSYVILATWLFIGTISYFEPYGWGAIEGWGPRYLIPILPFITIASGTLFLYKNRLLKGTIIILCVAGFYVNLLGVLIWYQYGLLYGINVAGLAKYMYQPNGSILYAWLTIYTPYYSPIVLHTGALVSNYPSHIEITPAFINSWYTFGNAPCSYDNYILCKFGIKSVLLLSVIIAALATLIMTEIYKFNLGSSFLPFKK